MDYFQRLLDIYVIFFQNYNDENLQKKKKI